MMRSEGEISTLLDKLRSLHISTPRDIEFALHLDRVLQRGEEGQVLHKPRLFTRTGETRGVLVIDGPGGGKSHLVYQALSTHPALAGKDGGASHYIETIVPSPATAKSMALEVLGKTGYPISTTRREVWALWQLVRDRLAMLEKTVLWIDEAHDLFCADRNAILRMLKSLMQGDDAMVVILSGTELLGDIIRSDPQVQRRFSTIRLASVSGIEDGQAFLQLVESYCKRAGIEPPVSDEAIAERLVHASRYRFGRAIKTIIDAIEQALYEEDEQLDLVHFARAWAMDEGCPPEENVFLAEKWHLINLDRKVEMKPPSRRRSIL